ncbi:histidine phosphatase superfamily [Parachaetomium inaequale]|uniref:Histidine phosphatase superfamily n=1 Tax=Parachaetomium inaequale TaxID=2588326 RepID=A0AAN6PAB0_9PEZI|nr:histidine phosphatase superfamily [Parachaetomium inaequale]
MTTMRLFLVRHGETVDNVAGIYAGTRDSPLTAHGVLQARRLGAHLAAIGPVKHIFASDLRRAVETARAVVEAQSAVHGVAVASQASGSSSKVDVDGRPNVDGTPLNLKLVQLPELRERDFGSAEGKKFGIDLVLGGAESREQMSRRAERFVDGHLVPLFTTGEAAAAGGCVVVVAHGLILDSLLRVLLARFGPLETVQPGGMRATGWSNTGYVELVVGVGPNLSPSVIADGPDGARVSARVSGERTPAPLPQQPQVTLSVVGVNVLKHLEGLKKTRGGIGSAQFDKRQRTMDSFFGPTTKKARVEREPEKA